MLSIRISTKTLITVTASLFILTGAYCSTAQARADIPPPWPQYIIYNQDGILENPTLIKAPMVDDIVGDNYREVIYTARMEPYGDVVGVREHFGAPISGWPILLTNTKLAHGHTITGDFNNDGINEIIVASLPDASTGSPGQIYVFCHNGQLLNGWPRAYDGDISSLDHSIMLIDLNGNGMLELVIYSIVNNNVQISVFDYHGQALAGFPVLIPLADATKATNGFSASDLLCARNGLEIVVITPEAGSAMIHIIGADGQVLRQLPISNVEQVYSPVIIDLNKDGLLDIAFGADTGLTGQVHVVESNGQPLDGWPVNTRVHPKALSVADMFNDGNYQLIAATRDEQLDINNPAHIVTILDEVGNHVLGFPFTFDHPATPTTASGVLQEVISAQLDDDIEKEIILTFYSESQLELFAFNYDGSFLSGFPQYLGYHSEFIGGGPSVADVDLNQLTDLIRMGYVDLGARSYIDVTDVLTPMSESDEPWPMFRRNNRHQAGFDHVGACMARLDVTVSGASSVVTSNPSGIDCGTDCSDVFSLGDDVALSATIPTGFELDPNLSDPCFNNLGECSLTLNDDQTVAVHFRPIVTVKPDLRIQQLKAKLTKQNKIRVEVSVQNIGEGPATTDSILDFRIGGFTVRWYKEATINVPPLKPGEKYFWSYDFDVDLSDSSSRRRGRRGPRWHIFGMRATADALDTLDESNESNNSRWRWLFIRNR